MTSRAGLRVLIGGLCAIMNDLLNHAGPPECPSLGIMTQTSLDREGADSIVSIWQAVRKAVESSCYQPQLLALDHNRKCGSGSYILVTLEKPYPS